MLFMPIKHKDPLIRAKAIMLELDKTKPRKSKEVFTPIAAHNKFVSLKGLYKSDPREFYANIIIHLGLTVIHT